MEDGDNNAISSFWMMAVFLVLYQHHESSLKSNTGDGGKAVASA